MLEKEILIQGLDEFFALHYKYVKRILWRVSPSSLGGNTEIVFIPEDFLIYLASRNASNDQEHILNRVFGLPLFSSVPVYSTARIYQLYENLKQPVMAIARISSFVRSRAPAIAKLDTGGGFSHYRHWYSFSVKDGLVMDPVAENSLGDYLLALGVIPERE